MKNRNYVFIARSLDGFIADKKGNIDWLETIPNPDGDDCGYLKFIEKVDAIVMGRSTFEKVLSFNIPWPYTIPVFVVSNTLIEVPVAYKGKVEITNGTPSEIIEKLGEKGHSQLYIDGGATVQGFLKEDLIDELIITTIPILLGGGIHLFTELPKRMEFNHVKSTVFLNELVQDTYRRKR